MLYNFQQRVLLFEYIYPDPASYLPKGPNATNHTEIHINTQCIQTAIIPRGRNSNQAV